MPSTSRLRSVLRIDQYHEEMDFKSANGQHKVKADQTTMNRRGVEPACVSNFSPMVTYAYIPHLQFAPPPDYQGGGMEDLEKKHNFGENVNRSGKSNRLRFCL
ncbi:hypothetical protein EGR_08349 [Echinococcus granulosus]|uniref:Uncharacterized protein n=1 Tax=Echinococcus granulosus TaxID=6210 RepID=W6U8M8_ECHGR|nr:hypothetical protein EGR_08349 [Echinococcus granulosus]EUB56771.1 hypothetical protein EGR_08349 [Echinococcus granulosus]